MPPLVRATLPTALPTVRQLIGDLKKTVRETGSSPSLDNLALGLDAVDAYGSRRSLDVELVVCAPLDPDEAGKIASWIGPGFHPNKLLTVSSEPAVVEVPGPPLDLRVQIRTATSRVIQRAGTPRAPILVLVATKPFPLSDEDRSAFERSFEDRPHVVLVASGKKIFLGPPAAADATPPAGEGGGDAAPSPDSAASAADEPWFKDLEAKAKSGGWSCLTLRALTDTTLQTRLSSPPMDSLHDLFRAHSSVVALDSLTGVFDMILNQQQNEIRVNKAVTQQKLAKYGSAKPGGAAPPSPIADLLADLKARVQRLSQEFERGAGERLQDLLGAPAGLLIRETEQLLASLDELQLEEKTKTLGCKVPGAFEEKMNKLIRERVGRHCAGDLVALNDLFRLIGQEFDRTLAQAQGPPIVVQFRYLTDERVRRMLDMYGIFQSAYKGEMPRPGFGEYFSSVRKYSMILVMIASMFGMSALVRQYREITVPITVLLVAFGSYQVAVGTKKQRVENTETQLENARIAMRQDVRRIIGELQKQWGLILNQYLGEQISGAIGELDAALKQYQGRKGAAEVDPDKERLQRQAQALDASEKKLAASAKSKDGLQQSVTQVRGDLKGLMPGPGGAPGAKPGMPGAPGLARPGMPGAAGLAGAKPGMPAKPAAPAGPNPVAEAKAKLEAMKAAKAAPPPPKPAPAAPAAPPAAAPAAAAAAPAGEAKPSAAAAFQAKMAAMKAAKAAPAPAAEAAAPAAPAAAAPPAAAPATDAAAPAGEAKPSAAAAFQAKMAAMKAAKAAGAAGAAAAAPASAAAPAAPAAPAETPPAEAAPAAPEPPAPEASAEPAPPQEHGFAETMAIPPAEKVSE